MWTDIILDPQEVPSSTFADNTGEDGDGFVSRIAAFIYSDIKRAGHLFFFSH